MSSIVIFIATLLSVIAIGMQTRAISKNQMFLAAFSASVVAMGYLFALKLVPQTTNPWDYVAYILANSMGIFISFKIHAKVTVKGEFKKPFDFCNNRERKCEFREDGKCSESREGCPVYVTFIKRIPAKQENKSLNGISEELQHNIEDQIAIEIIKENVVKK